MAKVYSNGSHTCIMIKRGASTVSFIPIKDTGLEVENLFISEFEEEGWKETIYNAADAAKSYLNFAKLHGASDKALQALQEVCGKELQLSDRSNKMAKKKVVEEQVEEVPALEPAPETPAKKAGRAKKSAQEVSEIKKPRGRAPKDLSWKEVAHIVVAPEKVKKGFLLTYVGYASGRKNFKLKDLVKKFPEETEERITRYFEWCRTKGIFAPEQA